MTTINSLTRDTLCTAAISKLGVLAKGQVPDPDDISKAALSLNMLVSYLRARQLPLWARAEYLMPLTSGVSSYTIGVGKTLNTPFPLKMLDAVVVNISNGNTRVPIDIIAKSEYNVLPVNTSSSMPVKISYQPLINSGQIDVWPVPNDSVVSSYKILLTYQRPFEYFSSATDTLDMPEEWYLPVVYKLAVLLAPEWGIPLEDRKMLMQEASEYITLIDSFGEEDASITFSPRMK